MSITDELREFAPGIHGYKLLRPCDEKELRAIANRIDAEHEKAVCEAYAKGMGVAKTMTECMVELPKDADDVPWNPGDCDEDGNVVITLKLASSGWYVITDGDWPYRPESKRHYHTLTVEDVLREFANGWDLAEGIGKADIYIKNFAAKLRLKED